MNKLLYTTKLGKIKSVEVGDNSLKISYGKDKQLQIHDYHDQDCCENVYADWGMLEYHIKQLVGLSVEKLEIKSVKEMGFLLCFQYDYDEYIKIFIPCYNEQNGYYGDDLELRINNNGQIKTIDISDLTEFHEK